LVRVCFPLKCYKTHTCSGGQRKRGWREGGEKGRCAPLPPKCYKKLNWGVFTPLRGCKNIAAEGAAAAQRKKIIKTSIE